MNVLSKELADKLDFELAWRRMRLDRPDRCFTTHPFLQQWIETDLGGWLENVRISVANGYSPKPIQTCEAPKGNWMVRPGACLHVVDELMLNALVGLMLPDISEQIGWSQGTHDIAYQLSADPTKLEWVSRGFTVWREWRVKCLEMLGPGAQFMVAADVAAFYENIDIDRLSSDLKNVGADGVATECLIRCLRRWAEPRGKGIPQGTTAADILAKLYLGSVDEGLKNAGFRHLRYVDDIRIFCPNALQARRALLTLNRLVRNRGLNLQAAKTKILRLDEARQEIDGVAPIIAAINSDFNDEITAVLGLAEPYLTLDDIEEAISANPDTPPLPVLERAFQDHFGGKDHDFNKTLFHYLLSRLAKTKSEVAVEYCIGLLPQRPEETGSILRYLAQVDLHYSAILQIITYISSNEAIYDYQIFEVLRWFYDLSICPDGLLKLCRGIAWDRNRLSCLRSYAIALLGAHGSTADMEQIEAEYENASTETEQAEIVACLSRVESGRRNAFYRKVAKDGELVKRAVHRVKAEG